MPNSLFHGRTMPLSCSDGENKILSFALSDAEWKSLNVQNRERRHLHFNCCGSKVSLRVSKLGNRYFAHAKRGECSSAPETAEHLLAKTEVCLALAEAGWHCVPEHRIEDAKGMVIADVFAAKRSGVENGVVFEIQWSQQADERTIERSDRYRENGMRPLWLFRQSSMPVSKDIPAVRLDYIDGRFFVRLPGVFYTVCSTKRERERDDAWSGQIPLREFILGVTQGKFRWGLPEEIELPVEIYGAYEPCYRCGTENSLAVYIALRFDRIWPGYADVNLSARTLGEKSGSVAEKMKDEMQGFLQSRNSRPLTMRYSKTVDDHYLAHTCKKCEALYGHHFMFRCHVHDEPSRRSVITTTVSDGFFPSRDVWTFEVDGKGKFQPRIRTGRSIE